MANPPTEPFVFEFLRNLGEDDFPTDMDIDLKGRLRDINVYMNGLVDAKRTFGKTVRDELSKLLDYMVNVIKKLYSRIDIARSELESVRELNTDSEISVLEDKIKDLEKKNAELDLEISEYTGTMEMFKEMINGHKNENKIIIREEVRTAVEESNRKIPDEIKFRGNFANTVTFAQIMDNNAGFPVLSIASQERESVLLLKPIDEKRTDFFANKNLITKTLNTDRATLKIKTMGKIFGGGVKIITDDDKRGKR
ncbi:hypothetical protein AVEN_35141-1 [Araneus ventricosus]|uniref:Uncharacterized protein n=1 Tax=Araneus ventricosus TaxID=182803 RepID=A0A4Y2R8C6_ARAVE|nr:hypothetical protein AVEN_35141-1 [Araneus ventricosus]